MSNNVNNYLLNSNIEVLENGDDRQLKIYNNTGTALTAYCPYMIVPGWITGVGFVYVPIAVATCATASVVVGVPQAAIADKAWGFVYTRGYCLATTSGTVTGNDRLQVINAGVSFIREGSGADGLVQPGTDVSAISVANSDTNLWYIYLTGVHCTVAAS